MKEELSRYKKKALEAQKDADKIRDQSIPQIHMLQDRLREHESVLKQKFTKEYQKKEEVLTSKLIKQKYQLQEEQEKAAMLTR